MEMESRLGSGGGQKPIKPHGIINQNLPLGVDHNLENSILDAPPLQERSAYCDCNRNSILDAPPLRERSTYCVNTRKQHFGGPPPAPSKTAFWRPRQSKSVLILRLFSKSTCWRPCTRRAFRALCVCTRKQHPTARRAFRALRFTRKPTTRTAFRVLHLYTLEVPRTARVLENKGPTTRRAFRVLRCVCTRKQHFGRR